MKHKKRLGMEKHIWSTFDVDNGYIPYVALKCNPMVIKEIERMSNDDLWKFIADRLHKKYPEHFPDWLDQYGERHAFWYGYYVLEDYNKVYKRMTKERMEHLKDKFKDKDDLRCEAEWQVWEVLESLPVFVL